MSGASRSASNHLLSANREMFPGMDAAMDGSRPANRPGRRPCPFLPRVLGRVLIRFTDAGRQAEIQGASPGPAASNAIDGGSSSGSSPIQHEAPRVCDRSTDATWRASSMASPFASFITYTVLDGWRLIGDATSARHFEQARRVTRHLYFHRPAVLPAATAAQEMPGEAPHARAAHRRLNGGQRGSWRGAIRLIFGSGHEW